MVLYEFQLTWLEGLCLVTLAHPKCDKIAFLTWTQDEKFCKNHWVNVMPSPKNACRSNNAVIHLMRKKKFRRFVLKHSKALYLKLRVHSFVLKSFVFRRFFKSKSFEFICSRKVHNDIAISAGVLAKERSLNAGCCLLSDVFWSLLTVLGFQPKY